MLFLRDISGGSGYATQYTGTVYARHSGTRECVWQCEQSSITSPDVDVSGVPVGQCRLEASGAASVPRVVAGTVIREADGARIIQAASTQKEDHYAAVRLSIPAAASSGNYALVSFAQAVGAGKITGYGAELSRQIVGGDSVAYTASSGQIVWQDNPWHLRADYSARRVGETVMAKVVCNELPEEKAS
jgi:hypothetical protein